MKVFPDAERCMMVEFITPTDPGGWVRVCLPIRVPKDTDA